MGLLDRILAGLNLQRSVAKDDDSFEEVRIEDQPANVEAGHQDIPQEPGIDPRFIKIIDDKIKRSNEKLLVGMATVIDEAVGDLESGDQSNVAPEIEQLRIEVKKNFENTESIKSQVDEKIKEHAATLDAFIDVVSERVNNDRVLADCFKQDDCPFDPKIKRCPMWMHRPVKNDAPNYCAPCRLQKMLREKGL